MNVPALLNEAARLHARGDLVGARRQAEEALAADPRNINAMRFVGVLYCQTGEPGIGADFLTNALRQQPADLPTRLNAMQALLDAGRTVEAEKLGGEAAAAASNELLRLRAAAARQLGKAEEAIQLLRQAAEAAPSDYACWNNLGNALHEAGRFDEAIDALERASAVKPDDAVVGANLARALAAAGRQGDGLAALQELAARNPTDAQVHWELAEAVRKAGNSAGALPYIGRAAELDGANPRIFTTMGVIFGELNDLAKAEQAYRIALQVGPTHAPAYLNLGVILEQANRLDELRALIAEMSRQGLRGDELRFLAALVLRREGKLEEALELAQATSAGGSLDANMRAHLIGQLADRLDRPGIAFDAFVDMHQAMARTAAGSRFDGNEARAEIERMSETLTPGWVAGWRDLGRRPAEDTPPAPAFLVGFLRSGTTLLDTMLMGHSDTHVMEEEPILARVADQLESMQAIGDMDPTRADELRRLYFAEAAKAGASDATKLLVDKNPLASLRSPLIQRLFPDARFIFALRHPCDVVLSCFMQNFKINEMTASFLNLDNAARYYDAVMGYWTQCQQLLPLRVHVVRYEQLVADQERELRALTEFLGLKWQEDLLAHEDTAAARGYIRTPSYAQVTEGLYDRAAGRWTKYREQLEPILPILAPWVERFGYSLD